MLVFKSLIVSVLIACVFGEDWVLCLAAVVLDSLSCGFCAACVKALLLMLSIFIGYSLFVCFKQIPSHCASFACIRERNCGARVLGFAPFATLSSANLLCLIVGLHIESFGVEWCNSVILRDTRAGELLYHHIVMIGINAFVESFLWELLGCA